MWVAEIVGKMAFYTGDKLGSCGKESFFLAQLGVMRDGTSILQGDTVAHLVIHARD